MIVITEAAKAAAAKDKFARGLISLAQKKRCSRAKVRENAATIDQITVSQLNGIPLLLLDQCLIQRPGPERDLTDGITIFVVRKINGQIVMPCKLPFETIITKRTRDCMICPVRTSHKLSLRSNRNEWLWPVIYHEKFKSLID